MLYDITITFYQRGRRRKKRKGMKKIALIAVLHIFFTPARDTRHMPRLHAKMASIVRKPFTSFAKIPTRDPEILPCYWRVAANSLNNTHNCMSSVFTLMQIHTHQEKLFCFLYTYFPKTLLAPLFSSPNVLYQLGKEMESLLVLAPRLISLLIKTQIC